MDNLRKSISIKQPLDPIFMLVRISALVTNNLYFLLSLLKWCGFTCFGDGLGTWGAAVCPKACYITLFHPGIYPPILVLWLTHWKASDILKNPADRQMLGSIQQQLERRKCNVIYSVKCFFVAVSSVLLSAQRQRCTFRHRSTIIKHDTFGVTVRQGRKECNRARVVSTSLCRSQTHYPRWDLLR